MTKSELIKNIAQKMNTMHVDAMHEKDIERSINQIICKMAEVLCAGTRIEIRGFGSFSLHYHPARNAHNPKTGEKLVTDPKHSPHFKPGKELRERVNANKHFPIKQAAEEVEE
jgi:integration host factor subunit beta